MEKKYSSLSDMIANRNALLKKFFTSRGFNVTLIGDYNQPVVIVRDDSDVLFAVGGYVKNFMYHFTDIPFGGHSILSVNLNSDNDDITYDMIADIFEKNEQRNVYVLQHAEDESLLFSIVADKSGESHVYWSKTDPRYFLSIEKAKDTADHLKSEFNINTRISTQMNSL